MLLSKTCNGNELLNEYGSNYQFYPYAEKATNKNEGHPKKCNVQEKEIKWKKKTNKATEAEEDILLMCKTVLQITKLFSFLFTSNFGSFLTDNIALTAFIMGKKNDNVDIALRRGDILQGQYPAFIHLHRIKIYQKSFQYMENNQILSSTER